MNPIKNKNRSAAIILHSLMSVLGLLDTYYQDVVNEVGQFVKDTYRVDPEKIDWVHALTREFGWKIKDHLPRILDLDKTPGNFKVAQRICRGIPAGFDYVSLLVEIAYVFNFTIGNLFDRVVKDYELRLLAQEVLFDDYLPLSANAELEKSLFYAIIYDEDVDTNCSRELLISHLGPHWKKPIKDLFPRFNSEE